MANTLQQDQNDWQKSPSDHVFIISLEVNDISGVQQPLSEPVLYL
jgi:hypothetical protein